MKYYCFLPAYYREGGQLAESFLFETEEKEIQFESQKLFFGLKMAEELRYEEKILWSMVANAPYKKSWKGPKHDFSEIVLCGQKKADWHGLLHGDRRDVPAVREELYISIAEEREYYNESDILEANLPILEACVNEDFGNYLPKISMKILPDIHWFPEEAEPVVLDISSGQRNHIIAAMKHLNVVSTIFAGYNLAEYNEGVVPIIINE